MKHRRFYQLPVFWLCCTTLWCILIFCFSAQDATKSTAVSDLFLHRLERIYTLWIPVEATESGESSSISLAFLIRKVAHFTLYFLLGIFSSATTASFASNRNHSLFHSWLCAWGFCIFYATTDEIHQLFVPGRTGRLLDVCIDSFGALFGSLCVFFLVSRTLQRHQEQNPEKGV